MDWYCLYLKSRSEFVAERGLMEQNFDVYLPKTIDYKIDIVGKIKPLFPEYMFINLEIGMHDFKSVKYTKGVKRFAPNAEPLIISDQLIDTIKEMENSKGFHEVDSNHYHVDDKVTILDGPFAMYDAIIGSVEGDRIRIFFEYVEHKMTIEVSKLDIVLRD